VLNFQFLTLFPESFHAVLGSSLLGKAHQNGVVSFGFTQIRDFATDRHRTVDDTPYGGGEGMLLKVDVLHAAWKAALSKFPSVEASASEGSLPTSEVGIFKSGRADTQTLLMSPQGKLFTQNVAKTLARTQNLIIVCGHYEGVDERFVELCVDQELSIGDYVLTGGELPAMVIADTVTRLLPGVVGNESSVTNDSLEGGLLKYPQYTRPRVFEGAAVPEILLSGDHGAIEKWRREQMLQRTRQKRPELLKEKSST
jgi:tRNA (guanine37-N1)-methyltransferase